VRDLVSAPPRDPGAPADEPLLDLRGETCPFTLVRARLRLEELPLGGALTVLVDHPPAFDTLPRALRDDGQEVLAAAPGSADVFSIRVRKRAAHRLARPAHVPNQR
jgi:TusA-related sulfurtransferase